MNILLISLGFILAFIIVLCYEYKIRRTKPRNKVHFYVARDKDGSLWLYAGKPFRDEDYFCVSPEKKVMVLSWYGFEGFGLNKNDYDNLKWEDEPVEVFLNLED